MTRTKVAVVIILLIACIAAGAAVPKPEAWDSLPKVNGKIVDCLPSPDHSRIAVVYEKPARFCPDPVIAIYDVVEKRLVGEVDPIVGALSAQWTWSPDSKWLNVPDDEQGLRLISRNGKVADIPTKKYVTALVWRADQPSKFLYTSCDSYVYEYDLDRKSERRIKSGLDYAEELFNVNGKPCVSGEMKLGSAKPVRLVDTGRTAFNPARLSESEWSSIKSIELSPDSRFVSLACDRNKGCLGIIARKADLASVLRNMSKALYVKKIGCPIFPVAWDAEGTFAIVDGRAVDLRNGRLKPSPDGVKRLAGWSPIVKNGRQIQQWLAVDGNGLFLWPDDPSLGKTPLVGQASTKAY